MAEKNSKFAPPKSRHNIREENLGEIGLGAAHTIVKFEQEFTPSVTAFDPPKIIKAGEGDYSQTRVKYGPLAATDEDRGSKSQKDSRFMLNPLLRDPLAVEDEERRVIEERVRARVQAVADEARADAAVVGYRDGLAKGHEEAFAKFRQESVARTERFESLVKELEGARAVVFQANQQLLVDLIFRISKLVLLRELKADKEYLLRLTKDLVERVGVRENIRVRLHPDDLASVSMLKEGLEQTFGQLKNLAFEPSPEVKLGGCQIETEFNAIDASIDNQIKGVFESLVSEGPGT